MITEIELQKICQIVRDVGDYQVSHQHKIGSISQKSPKEFVSEVDKNSETMLREKLSHVLPEAGFHGEEFGKTGSQEIRWIVDPLDGTTNYVNKLPYYAISVALYQNEHALLGVVYQPATGNLWSAIDGGEFMFNNMPAVVKDKSSYSLSSGIISTGFPYRSPDLRKSFYDALDFCLLESSGVRRMGSAALDLCYQAMGCYVGFFETDLEPYDIAASMMFVRMLGFNICSESGLDYKMGESRLFISSIGVDADRFTKGILESYASSLSS